MKLLSLFLLSTAACAQSWVSQPVASRASLRGISAVNARTAWASGTGGTWLKTTDGGTTWLVNHVPGAETLDFRDIQAVDEQRVYLLSIGPGDKSRIYKTVDGGANWTLQFTNPDAKGFFDAMAFWDANHGILVGDPVDGHFVIFTTGDGGAHWERRPTPPSLPNEGAFAASGTCIVTMGDKEVWFATGGPGAARVFHSPDSGATWTVAITPIRNDGPSAGVFSLAFSDSLHGVAVGGDYAKPEIAEKNVAITSDGGKTWTEPSGHPKGFRSAVLYLPEKKMWIATGTSGSDISTDGGATWQLFDNGAYNAISFAGSAGWAVGPGGRVAAMSSK
ncbi:MAG TPA: hypothetical protein VKU19_16695 [Bryobacteraceae bacterium]|nr:hypothetical protein [Bryobacteraceae bacterium]